MSNGQQTETPTESTPSRSEIENALSGRTKRNKRKAKRPESNTFDLSAPPRRQQVIGGKLNGVSKRNRLGVFSRYSDVSIANWVAIAFSLMILAAFFWPNTKDTTQEIESPEQLINAKLGETDLSLEEQSDILNSEELNSKLEFSRNSDLDRATFFRRQEAEDKKIRDFIDKAKRQIAKGQYLKPDDDNAVVSYKSILLLNPNNVAAKQGLEFIKNRFLNIALLELEKDNLTQAVNISKKLAIIDTDAYELDELNSAIENWKRSNKVKEFLALGNAAYIKQNLILPSKKNALHYYKQALNLDSNNADAILGVNNVARHYVGKAQQAIDEDQYQAVAAHIATISLIDPEHEAIEPLNEALERAKTKASNNTPETVPQLSQNPLSTTPIRTPSQQTLEQQTFDKQYLKEGLESYYLGDYEKAASLLQPLADKGIARAQFRLAYMHYLGRGFSENRETADAMIRAALPAIQRFANDNRAWAQSDLGSLYEDGLVLARDYNKAVAWYQAAANQGYPGAQTNLGLMYARGRGVNTSRQTAIEWFKKAASQGDNVAKRNLAALGIDQ